MADAEPHRPGETVVFARLPGCGGGKRRLAAAIGDSQAAALATAFFEDSLALALNAGLTTTLAYDGSAADVERVLGRFERSIRAVPQCTGGMGERILGALAEVAGRGRSPVLIGSDTPDLPPRLIAEAVRQLRRGAELVLGPAADGGFYLIAVRTVDSRLFEGVTWSTPAVFSTVLRNAELLGLATAALEPWSDVDDLNGLLALQERLLRCPVAAPATRRALASRGGTPSPGRPLAEPARGLRGGPPQ